MLTFTGSRSLYGKLTNNNSTENLALGDTLINADTRRLLRKLGTHILEKTSTDTSETNVQYYPKPARMKKLKTITVTVGTTKWPVNESPSRDHWDRINQTTSYTSNIPEWWYSRTNDIGFWPIFSGTASTITYVYDIVQKDLGTPDYTTGQIFTATNGTTTIAGTASTGWNRSMDGLFLRVNGTAIAANIGDNEWYEISSVIGGTAIVLSRNYVGGNITSGTASYAIGQVSALPDGFHELPVYRAVATYYSKIDQNRYQNFKVMADNMELDLFSDAGNETTNVVVSDIDESETTNPNLQIEL